MKKLIIYSNLILLFFSNICASQDYWELVNSPDSVSIFDIAVDSEGRIYLACPFSTGNLTGIFRSDDNCEAWQRKVVGMDSSFSPHTRSITIDNDDIIVTGCDSRIYRSINLGETWLEVYHATPASYSFNVAESGFDSIILVGGESTYGLVRSGNNGLNWMPVLDFANFDPDYPEALTGVCYGPDGNIYACTRTYVGGYGSVYISEDLGFTWSVFFNDGYSQFFSIDFDQQGRLLVGSDGLYRYDFTLSFWEHIPYNIAPYEILVLPNAKIYLACNGSGPGAGGVALSQDGGNIYELINSGMNDPNATDFAGDDIGRILVSGNTNNLYRSYDTLITGLENINDEINGEPFSCYPNPYENFTTIISNIDKPAFLRIYDLAGNLDTTSSLEPFGTYILSEALPKGLYLAVVITEDFKTVIKIIHL